MKTIKTLMILALIGLVQFTKAQGYGEIRGLIKDDELNPVIGAVVKITQGGYLVGGTTTDADGKYVYKPLNAGEYEVIVTSSEHTTLRKTKVPVDPNEATYVDLKMTVNTLSVVIIETEFEKPMVDATMIDIISMNAEDWNNSVNHTEGALEAISNSYSGAVKDNQGEWHFHGARTGATEYIIDGVRVTEMSGLPNASIENISMINGGVPAMYGDLTSGVIVVTTKDYFSMMRHKNVLETRYKEKREFKNKQKSEKQDEENRKKEIEQEKAKDKEKK